MNVYCKKLLFDRRYRLFLYLSLSLAFAVVAAFFMSREAGLGLSFPLKTCLSRPQLADYPVMPAEIHTGRSAPADFSGQTAAWTYRTWIRLANTRGMNYAGHYVVAEWGCGSNCQNHAIVNAKTGRIVAFGLYSSYGVEFAKTSRLIVFNPRTGGTNNSGASSTRTAYYVMQNDRLVPICD